MVKEFFLGRSVRPVARLPAFCEERPVQQAAPGKDQATARAAGRGGLAIAVAKVSFILFGFAQQILLERLLGKDGYGEVSRVLVVVGIVNNVVVATSIQGVSRAVSAAPEAEAPATFARALAVHAAIAVVLSAAFALAAGFIADAIGAPHVATPLRLVASVVLLYGVYAPLVGSLNGRRRFLDQAGLDIGYGLMRTVGIAAGALVFLRAGASGPLGAIAGFVTAAALIVPAALVRAGIGKRGPGGPTAGEYLRFLAPLALGQASLNLLLQADFLILSGVVGRAAARLGLAAKASDDLVGVYRGVQLFSFLPYQMLMSITFILFPMLARARAERDEAAVETYTRTGVRLALLLTGMMCGAVSALGPHVLRFAFKDPSIAADGGAALRVLSLGMGAFSILGVTSAALTGLGRERASAALTTAAITLVAIGCMTFVPRAPFGASMLLTSAISTSIALFAVAVGAAFVLQREAKGFVAPATLGRVLLALGVTLAVGSRLPWMGKVAVLGEAAVCAVIYLGVLVVTGELGKKDLATVRKVLGRG